MQNVPWRRLGEELQASHTKTVYLLVPFELEQVHNLDGF